MRCRAAQHAGGVGGVCLQSARAVEATWNLRTAQGSNYELAALRSSAARALLVRGTVHACRQLQREMLGYCPAGARMRCRRSLDSGAAAHHSRKDAEAAEHGQLARSR